MRLRRGRWKNQKIIVVLGTLWIMGFAAWAFLLSDLLATSVNEGVLEGPREGVFWTAAQYRNVYTRFDRQLILYATHVDDNFDHVQMQLDSLSVSFGFLQRPSEVSEYWLRIPRARDEIAVLKGQGDSGSAAVRQPPPGQMGLGTHIPVAAPPKGWKPPKKPDSLTKGKPRR